jgi:hypothetical protein
LDALRKQGLGLAAVSYDSAAVLKNFAERHHLTYPLLSDPESKIIQSFGILNEAVAPGTATYGIPYPGTYVLDPQGKVVSKHFEDDYRERTSATDILVREFGKSPDGTGGVLGAKQLRLTTAASTQVARPGHRIALSVKIELKPGMHVYAPGVQGYIPIDWKLEDGAAAKPHAFSYPASRMMHLKAIGETVPVYRGLVQMTREITFGPEAALKPLVRSSGELIVRGSFGYQACDERKCYAPETIPLEWRFQFQALERERVPADLQRKRP